MISTDPFVNASLPERVLVNLIGAVLWTGMFAAMVVISIVLYTRHVIPHEPDGDW